MYLFLVRLRQSPLPIQLPTSQGPRAIEPAFPSATIAALGGINVRALSALVAVLSLAAAAHADSQQVRRGPAPAWVVPSEMLPVPANVSGPIFARRQDVVVHVSDTGQAQYSGSRFKILQSNALELGNISIAWNPAAGAPIVHEIKVYRDGQSIDVLQNASFEILRRENQLEAATLDGILTAVLHVPDLRVGDELEIDLTSFGNDPTLLHHESGILLLAPSPAPGRYHLGLNWEQGHQPNVKMTADLEPVAQRSARAIDLRFDNPPPLSPPNDAPPRYQWQRILQYSDFADWESLSRHFAPLYAKAATLTPGSALMTEAQRIAAAYHTPLDRAAAALKLVQQDVRYVYVGLNGGNLQPATADETWKRRYGDCKAKTVLLLALLKQLGVDAEAVLVSSTGNDDGLEQRLPIPQLFDHVLVRVHIDGVNYWLDGTLPPVARASLQPFYPITRVLPLSIAGSPLERLAWQPPAVPDEINLYDADARAGFDKPAHIVSTTVVRGIKGLQQDVQFSAVTSAQLLAAFRQHAIGDTFQTIDDVQWHYDEQAGASILKISGTGTIDWQDDGNGAKSLALPGGGFSPPDRRVRTADQDAEVPFYQTPDFDCYVTTIRLPASTQPKQWTSKPSFVQHLFGRTYYRAWELRDGSVRMVRTSRVEQPEISAANARRDNARVAAFDNSMGWLSYDPAGRRMAVGNGEHVPAADEVDWASTPNACLPPGDRQAPAPTATAAPEKGDAKAAATPVPDQTADAPQRPASNALPPIDQLARPDEQAVLAELARAMSGPDGRNPKTILPVLDRALAKLPRPTMLRGYVQLMRAAVLGALDRHAEAIAAVEDSVRLLPGYSGPLLTAAQIYLYSNNPGLASDALIRASEIDPEDVRRASDYETSGLLGRLDAIRDQKRAHLLSDRLLAIGWTGSGVGSRSQLAAMAIRQAMTEGEVTRARSLVPNLLEPGATYQLLAERAFEPIWPDLEKWAGPNLSNQWALYLTEARKRWLAGDDPERGADYASALRTAGDLDTLIAEFLPRFDKPVDPRRDWPLLFIAPKLVNALMTRGRTDDALAVYKKASQSWPLGSSANALNLYANEANALLYADRPAEALAKIDAAIADSHRWPGEINVDAIGGMHQARACILHALGRDTEAAVSASIAGQVGHASQRVELALCMGKPAEAEAALLKALAVPEERTTAIGFMQPDDAPVIPTAYARKRHADMEALRRNPRLLAALAPFGRILPFALSDGAPKTAR